MVQHIMQTSLQMIVAIKEPVFLKNGLFHNMMVCGITKDETNNKTPYNGGFILFMQ